MKESTLWRIAKNVSGYPWWFYVVGDTFEEAVQNFKVVHVDAEIMSCDRFGTAIVPNIEQK